MIPRKFGLGRAPPSIQDYFKRDPFSQRRLDQAVAIPAQFSAMPARLPIVLRYSPQQYIAVTVLRCRRLHTSQSHQESDMQMATAKSDYYLLEEQKANILNAIRALAWPPQIFKLFYGEDGLTRLTTLLSKLNSSLTCPTELHVNIDRQSRGGSHLTLTKSQEAKTGRLFPLQGSDFWDYGVLPTNHDSIVHVYIDSEPCYISTSTRHTVSGSLHAQSARDRLIKIAFNAGQTVEADREEILLINAYDEVMDGSSYTPYVHRSGRWQTPQIGSGGLTRATKTYALANGVCEADIPKTTLKVGEIIRLSHDARGFFYGQIRETPMARATEPKREAEQASNTVTLESVSPSEQPRPKPGPPIPLWNNRSFTTAYQQQQGPRTSQPRTGAGSVEGYQKRSAAFSKANLGRRVSPSPLLTHHQSASQRQASQSARDSPRPFFTAASDDDMSCTKSKRPRTGPREQGRPTDERRPSVAYIGDDIEAYDEKFSVSDDGSSEEDDVGESESEIEEDISEEDDSGGENFEPDDLARGSRKRIHGKTRLGKNVRQRKRTRLPPQFVPWTDVDVENDWDGMG